jgi:hypothetical protein
MRNLRNRVSAFALAFVMASGMALVFSTPVSAFDGSFAPPTNDQICAALDTAEDSLALVQNAYLKALLQKLIDAAQAKYGCGATV